MSLIDPVRRRFPLLFALILGLTIATGCGGGGTNPDPGDGNGDDTPDQTVSSITATALWEYESTSTTEPVTPVFDPPFGGEDLRITNGGQIRVTAKTYSDAVPQRLVLYSLDSSGLILWELEIPFISYYAPYISSSEALLTSDGWLFLLVDWYEEPESNLQIVAISPSGEIAWAAKPPDGLIESDWFDEYNNFFLDSNERLLTTDSEKRLYMLDRDGQVDENIDDAFADFNGTYYAKTVSAEEGLYVVESISSYYTYDFDWGDTPGDYLLSGLNSGGGHGILLLDPSFEISAAFDSCCNITEVTLRPEGGLIIGGDAGEIAAFDASGNEQWRYVPDQSRTLNYAWEYELKQHPPLEISSPIGVSDMAITDQGTVCVTTHCGNLYAVGAAGNLRWSWPNACGAPVIRNGYGVNVEGFHQWISPGASIQDDGTLKCGALTLDPETGELLEVNPTTGADYIIETSDGQILLCSGFTVTIVDRNGGELSQFTLPDRILSRPAIAPDDSLIIPTARGLLYSVSSDGAVQWEANIGCQVQCRPAVAADGRVFVIDINGTLTAVSATGGILWTREGMSTELLPPVAGPDGVAVVTEDDGTAWISFDGTVMWEYPNEDELLAPPAVSSTGLIAWGDKRGRIYLVDSAGNQVYQHFDKNVENPYRSVRVTQSPVFMPNGSLVVEFADWPYYGDISPNYFISTVKCIASNGEVSWELLDGDNRFRHEVNDWGEPPRLLLSSGLIDGKYVLLGLETGIWLYDETGLVCELSTTDEATDWTFARDTFPSYQIGIYTVEAYSAFSPWEAKWSEISIQ